MPQSLSEWLGVLGFLVAFGLLAWEIYKYRHERRERVKVSAALYDVKHDGRHLLELKVYNSGRIPVYLKGAELVWQEGGTLARIPLGVALVHHAFSGGEIIQNSGRDDTSQPLNVGGEQRFFLFDLSRSILKTLATLSRNQLWLSVYSPGGEICQLKGKVILPLIKELARLDEADLSLKPTAPIDFQIFNWELQYLSTNGNGEECRANRNAAQFAHYGFSVNILNGPTTSLMLRDMEVSFLNGDDVVWTDRLSNENPVITLPAREPVHWFITRIVHNGKLTKLGSCNRVVFTAVTLDGQRYEVPVTTLKG